MDTCGTVQGTPTLLYVAHSSMKTTRDKSVCTPRPTKLVHFNFVSLFSVLIYAECFYIISIIDFEHFTQELWEGLISGTVLHSCQQEENINWENIKRGNQKFKGRILACNFTTQISSMASW